MKNYIIVDDFQKDERIDYISKELALYYNIHVISISLFFKELKIEYNEKTGLLQTKKSEDELRNILSNIRVLDWVVEISKGTVENISKKDGLFLGEVYNAYIKILKYTNLVNKNETVYSTKGNLYTLPNQWQLIRKQIPIVKTPDYKWGYGPVFIDQSDMKHPITKSVFDFYNWNLEEKANIKDLDEFVVEKPIGDPILYTYMENQVNVFPIQSSTTLSQKDTESVKKISKEVISIFCFNSGEILWFKQKKGQWLFVVCSPYLSAAAQNPDFKSWVTSYINACFGSNQIDQEG